MRPACVVFRQRLAEGAAWRRLLGPVLVAPVQVLEKTADTGSVLAEVADAEPRYGADVDRGAVTVRADPDGDEVDKAKPGRGVGELEVSASGFGVKRLPAQFPGRAPYPPFRFRRADIQAQRAEIGVRLPLKVGNAGAAARIGERSAPAVLVGGRLEVRRIVDAGRDVVDGRCLTVVVAEHQDGSEDCKGEQYAAPGLGGSAATVALPRPQQADQAQQQGGQQDHGHDETEQGEARERLDQAESGAENADQSGCEGKACCERGSESGERVHGGGRVTGPDLLRFERPRRPCARSPAVFITVLKAPPVDAAGFCGLPLIGRICRCLILAAAVTACGAGGEGGREARRPNIVLYVVDTVRADRLGLYGYDKPTSPRLDAFAADALVFENAYAQSSWTRPAVASLFTGLLPPAHRAAGRRSVLAEDAVTLAEILSAAGYEAMGLVRNPNVHRNFGFAQGFSRFRSEDRDRDETMLERVRLWLDERRDPGAPFFLYLHAIDPHGPYDPAPEFERMFDAGDAPAHYRTVRYLLELNRRDVEPAEGAAEALSRLYDAEIAQSDRAFGDLLDELEARGLAADTAVIHVSDHGEEFQEHGRWEHGLSLYEEVLRVPFVMRLPGVSARRFETPAQHIDLLPTLLGYLGIRGPATDGRDLLAERRRGDAGSDVYAHLDLDGRRAAAVIRGRYKLVLPLSPSQGSEPLLFDLQADPGERENLAASRPAVVERLLEVLAARNLLGEVEPGVEIDSDGTDEELKRRLRALGYLD